MKQEAILRRFFSNRSTFSVDNHRGQAVIEYILLLVIVVSLILGMRGVFSSMNSFMSDMIGGYVSCLMEYGELPAFGVADSDLKHHQDGDGRRCPVPTFSAAASFGAGGAGGPNGGPGGRGTQNRGDGKVNNGNGAEKGGNIGEASDTGSGASGGGGGSRGSTARSRARNSSPYSKGQMSRAGGDTGTADGAELEDGKVKALAGPEEDGYGDGGRRSSRRATPFRPKSRAISGKLAAELEKGARMSRKPGSTLIGVDEGYRLTALKRTVNPPPAREIAQDKNEEGFSFGSFLKWLIIAGIVIACFILFGGQIMNYSNSDS